jgi:ubiquinone/menaquinone biosynthesis C-methylase UbiE
MSRSFDHPGFARRYARLAEDAERRGQGELRRELVAQATGTVCEVGSGHGLTFPHYPSSVDHVVAVEPESTLRAAAQEAGRRTDVHVAVVAGDSEHLPLSSGSVDTVVFALVLCSVDDQSAALAEAHRVLRPGGRLQVYEHVRSTRRLLGALETLVSPGWSRLAAGCHLDRDTLATVAAAGFEVERSRRFGFSPARGVPAVAHVLAQARRP